MIDTLHIRLNLNSNPKRDQYIKQLLKISSKEDHGKSKNKGEYYFLKFKDIIIEIEHSFIVSVKLSLTKYYFGENVSFMNKAQISEAIQGLEIELGIPIQRGYLSRIDVACNFTMQQSPMLYIDSMIDIDGVRTKAEDHGKYFPRSRQVAYVYNKTEELKQGSKDKHLAKEHPNVLRYELRLVRQMKSIFGKKVQLLMLHSASFLGTLAKMWLDHYQMINKRRAITNQVPQTPKDQYMTYLLENVLKRIEKDGDLSGIMAEIRTLSSINGWSPSQTTNQRNFFRNLITDKKLTVGSDLIRELDELIANSPIVIQYLKND